METKIITYYLPQYHEIAENNEWWGKGFTEWTNVKKAKPFVKNQTQPRIPLNNNYYDLMNKETIEWQTKLANEHGVYGFCYFHYYFKGGRKILEKPAENLLKWKDIPQNFCFFWANQSWRRTWSAVKGNATSWVSDDQKSTGSGMLLEQSYDGPKEWEDHFNYLLPFFKDSRYIKIDNKPFFAIYQINDIPDRDSMFRLWNRLAIENGFNGIHIVSVNTPCQGDEYVDAVLDYGGGMYSKTKYFKFKSHFIQKSNSLFSKLNISFSMKNIWSYKEIWKIILSAKPYKGVKNYPGGTVHYDETPRRGSKGMTIVNDDPTIFKESLKKQLKRAKEEFHSEYLFLDAWNEWGEGNYLEPDELFGYSFLNALKEAVEES